MIDWRTSWQSTNCTTNPPAASMSMPFEESGASPLLTE